MLMAGGLFAFARIADPVPVTVAEPRHAPAE
jgi:hypothetical protein